MENVLKDRRTLLFVVLSGFFITNALVAQFIGVKIFSLEETMGWETFHWSLFGQSGTLMFTAGVLLWPIVFIMTDVINEYFGQKGVRILSYLTVGLISFAFIMIAFAIKLAPAGWWITSLESQGTSNLQNAFKNIFGQSNWIIVGSLVAFLIGQVVDAYVFHRIRNSIGQKRIWLRATISTIVSQFIDSFVVLYIAFVLGPQKWSMDLFWAVGTVNYAYKVMMAILLIPLLYLFHWLIDRYLGHENAEKMRKIASQKI